MLLPDQIVPFLMHADVDVRSLAIRYLSEAHDSSPATAEDVWKSIDAFGGGEHNKAYVALASMPQTDVSLRRTLDALQGNPPANVRSHLEDVIRDLKSGLLMRYIDLVEQAPTLSNDVRDHVKQRVQLASVPPVELWDRLMEIGMSEEPDRQAASRLVDALSHSPDAAGRAISTLNDSSIQDWREAFALDVLGVLRFRPAADLVLQKLVSTDDLDLMVQSCVNTLVRVGSPHVVEAIQKQFAGWEWGPRVSAAGILQRIKLPQSETAAYALLQNEFDMEVRTFLASALCDLATTHGPAIDLLVQMVSKGEYDENILELDQDVAALCTIIGRPKPVAATSERKSPNPFRGAVGKQFAFADGPKKPAAAAEIPVSFDSPAPTTMPRPIRNKNAKTGRNDPCPCGSGKKYKKCCGK